LKIFGKIQELTQAIFRKSGFNVTVEPSTASADTTFQLPAAGGGTKTISTTGNKLSDFAATTSSELAGVVSDETGSGALVFANSPALVTPTGIVKGDVGLGNVDNTSDATKNAASATLTNKKLDDSTTSVVDNTDPTIAIKFNAAGTTGTTLTLTSNTTANRTVTFPDGTYNVVGEDKLQNLSNKTLQDSTTSFVDEGDINKSMKFQVSGLTSGLARTVTIPDASFDMVGHNTSQALSNKTIDADLNTLSNIENADIKTGAAIDAAKIHDGSVSNTEFGYLSTVTSNVQTQLDAKLDEGNFAVSTNTLSSTNTNGDIILDPNGTGLVKVVGSLHSDTGLQLEETGAGTDVITLQAPSNITASYSLTLPVDDGTSGQALITDGSGVLSWSNVATDSLNQYNVKVGDSGGTAAQVNTSLLGTISAEYTAATATMTIATPCVVTYASHGLATGDRIYFTTSGALPTGVSASTTYFITKVDANTFKLSTTIANMLAGTFVASSGSQSGTHTIYVGGFREKTKQYQGQYDGTTIAAGYIGEYTSAQVSGGSTTAADTWTASTGSLALTPGVWMLGYNVTLDCVSVDNLVPIFINVALYNGSSNIDETISFLYIPNILSTGNDIAIPASSQTVVNIPASSGSVTYSLRTRCNRPASGTSTDASVSILGTTITAGLTNPDNSSKIWAVRIA
jgi:hypothetical protein